MDNSNSTTSPYESNTLIQISELENRTALLEEIVGNFGSQQHQTVSKSTNLSESRVTSLIERVNAVKEWMTQLEKNHFTNFFKKFSKLDISGLESMINENNEEDDGKSDEFSSLLSTPAKVSIIIDSEDTIKNVARMCDTLQNLNKFVQFDFLNAVPQIHSTQLQPLQAVHDDQMQRTTQLSAQVQELMAAYNELVQIISQKFIYWDKLLSAYERKVDELLARQKQQEQQQ